MPTDLSEIDLGGILRFLNIFPDPKELGAAIEWYAKAEQYKAEKDHELDEIEDKIRKRKAELSKLDEDAQRKYHQVAAIIPESEGAARDILNAAQDKAAELVKEANATAAKIRQDADEYTLVCTQNGARSVRTYRDETNTEAI